MFPPWSLEKLESGASGRKITFGLYVLPDKLTPKQPGIRVHPLRPAPHHVLPTEVNNPTFLPLLFFSLQLLFFPPRYSIRYSIFRIISRRYV